MQLRFKRSKVSKLKLCKDWPGESTNRILETKDQFFGSELKNNAHNLVHLYQVLAVETGYEDYKVSDTIKT